MLIGITGTIGAGKGVVVDYLIARGYTHYSARSYFTKLLEEQGIEVTRANMIFLANGLRHQYGGSYVIDQLIQQAKSDGGDAVVESIRAIKEVETLTQHGGILIGVTADQQLRYERVVQRGTSLDKISFEQFVFDEQVEGTSSDPSDSNIFACLPLCDHVFANEGTMQELYDQLDLYIASLNLTE